MKNDKNLSDGDYIFFLDGDDEIVSSNAISRLVDGITWLKVKGTLKAGTDSYGEYYYIAANSIEVMNERGIDTVNN